MCCLLTLAAFQDTKRTPLNNHDWPVTQLRMQLLSMAQSPRPATKETEMLKETEMTATTNAKRPWVQHMIMHGLRPCLRPKLEFRCSLTDGQRASASLPRHERQRPKRKRWVTQHVWRVVLSSVALCCGRTEQDSSRPMTH